MDLLINSNYIKKIEGLIKLNKIRNIHLSNNELCNVNNIISINKL